MVVWSSLSVDELMKYLNRKGFKEEVLNSFRHEKIALDFFVSSFCLMY